MSNEKTPDRSIDPLMVYAKLPAQDIERAKHFYEEKLGLRPFAEKINHVYYEVRGSRFMIFPSQGIAVGTHDQLGFAVADLAADVQKLKANGVVFEEYPNTKDGIVDHGFMKVAWFKDSEGNLINLSENPGILTL